MRKSIWCIWASIGLLLCSCSGENEISGVTKVQSADEIQGTWRGFVSKDGYSSYLIYIFEANNWREESRQRLSDDPFVSGGTFTLSNGTICFKYQGSYNSDYSTSIEWWNEEHTQLNIGNFAFHRQD